MSFTDQIGYATDGIREITSGTGAILPEFVLLAGIVVVLLLNFFRTASSRYSDVVVFAIVILASYFTYAQFGLEATDYFGGGVVISRLGIFLKFTFQVALLLTIGLFDWENESVRPGIRNFLLLALLLGAQFMVVSGNYLIMFIAIELVSIPSYLLVSLQGKKQSYEAGIKYLLFGAVSTAILLYGISLAYGATGSLFMLPTLAGQGMATYAIATFILLALIFKMGMAPMHLWLPDVYESTAPAIVALFSYVPKIAAMGLLVLWLQRTGLWGNEVIQALLALFALISIVIGTFSAMWQTAPKRLLAYSAIAQSGFLLLGLIAFSDFGLRSFVFFAIIYLLMSYLVFYLVWLMEKRGVWAIDQYQGLVKQFPVFAISMVIVMISFTGLPPTAGFTGKLLLLSAFWMVLEGGLLWTLFFVAVFSALVALFFYLKIPYIIIFKEENLEQKALPPLTTLEKLTIGTLSIFLVFFFIKSDFLLNFINSHIFVP